VALIGAAALLAIGYGTLDVATILAAARDGVMPAGVSLAAGLLALAAILKSAQFPVHGWLTEVMETPTPVSALLHAGVINGGGFLLIRFADVMLLSPGVLAILVMVGGFTALFAGLAMLCQSAVKNSLAWSTIAQMGFMIMQCGLALFPLALLHIVAHSLYKAHAFLASGTAVDLVASIRRPGPIAIPSGWAVTRAFLVALAIYAVIGLAFGFETKSPQAVALGAILIFGVAYLIAQGLADAAPRELTRRTALYAVAASVSYFALQTGAEWLTAGTLPATPAPGPLEWTLTVLALVSFGLVAVMHTVTTVSTWKSIIMPFAEGSNQLFSTGVPVLAARVSSLPEVGGEAARYFEPEDDGELVESMRDLLEDRELRERHAALGLQHARRFTWSRTAARTLEVIREAAEEGRR